MDQAWPPSWNRDWRNLLVAAVITGSVAFITTVLRFIARRRKTARTGRREGLCWDDWLLLFTAIVSVLIVGASICVALYLTSTPRDQISDYFPCWSFFGAHLGWINVHGLATFSILALYKRHFGYTKIMSRWINTLVSVVVVWMLGATFWTVFGEGLPPSRYCTTGPNAGYQARILATSIVHFGIDVAVLATPIPVVRRLQRKTSHKLLLCIMYSSLGLITMGCSGLRFYYLLNRLHKPEGEVLHNSVKSVMWGIIEINVSVTVINTPNLMPIVDWCLERRKKVNDHMAKATHYEDAIDGMLLIKRKPRMSISASNDDPENPSAADHDEVYHLDEVHLPGHHQPERHPSFHQAEGDQSDYQLENQARGSLASSAAELDRRPSTFETTTSGNLHERELSRSYHVTNN